MERFFRLLGWSIVILIVLAVGDAVMADPTIPPELLAQKPTDTIPIGTRITPANWQQYSKFMPYGLQALFSGQHPPVAIPPSEGLTVGPTTQIQVPKSFSEDTEKYGGQAKLVPVPETGGYNLVGLTAGLPFPNPTEPLKGLKLAYNAYFHFSPAQTYVPLNTGPNVDRYGNVHFSVNANFFFRTNYLSDPEFPNIHTRPRPGPYWKIEYYETSLPESARYSASLNLYPDDPALTFDTYNYIPALRRSLRLASNARCTPAAGSDTTVDDLDGGMFLQYTLFEVKYRGTVKILVLANLNVAATLAKDQQFHTAVRDLDLQHGSWQLDDGLGRWELHNVIVLEATRLPNSPGIINYCYGSRVMYLDALLYNPWEVDLFDREMKLWKDLYIRRAPVTPSWGQRVWIDTGNGIVTMMDFQNGHYTSGQNETPPLLDSQVPEKYRDLKRYASPAGLDEIFQ